MPFSIQYEQVYMNSDGMDNTFQLFDHWMVDTQAQQPANIKFWFKVTIFQLKEMGCCHGWILGHELKINDLWLGDI